MDRSQLTKQPFQAFQGFPLEATDSRRRRRKNSARSVCRVGGGEGRGGGGGQAQGQDEGPGGVGNTETQKHCVRGIGMSARTPPHVARPFSAPHATSAKMNMDWKRALYRRGQPWESKWERGRLSDWECVSLTIFPPESRQQHPRRHTCFFLLFSSSHRPVFSSGPKTHEQKEKNQSFLFS